MVFELSRISFHRTNTTRNISTYIYLSTVVAAITTCARTTLSSGSASTGCATSTPSPSHIADVTHSSGTDGRTNWRTGGRMDGWKKGWADRQTDGRTITYGHKDGLKDGQTNGRTWGRMDRRLLQTILILGLTQIMIFHSIFHFWWFCLQFICCIIKGLTLSPQHAEFPLQCVAEQIFDN